MANTFAQRSDALAIARKTDSLMRKIKSVSYTIDRTVKYLDRWDTLYQHAECKMMHVPKNGSELQSHFTIFANLRYAGDSAHENHLINETHRYDGKYAVITRTEKDNISYRLVQIAKEKYDLEPHGIGQLLMTDNFQFINLYEYMDGSWAKDNVAYIEIDELNFADTPCYKIVIHMKNKPFYKKGLIQYYIRRSDYLPIGSSHYYEEMGEPFYSSHTLTNVEINPHLVPDMFKVDPQAIRAKEGTMQNGNLVHIIEAGNTAPAIKAPLPNGNSLSLPEKGKITVLHFWYASCKHCKKSVPDMNKLYAEYKSKGVEVVGINTWANANSAKSAIRKADIEYPCAHNGFPLANIYTVPKYPTVAVIDSEGKLQYFASGLQKTNYRKVRRQLKKLLGE